MQSIVIPLITFLTLFCAVYCDKPNFATMAKNGFGAPIVVSGNLRYGILTPPPKGIPAPPGTMFDDCSITFYVLSLTGMLGDLFSCQQTNKHIAKLEQISQNETTAVFEVHGKRLGREYIVCQDGQSEVEIGLTVLIHRGWVDRMLPMYVMVMVVLLNIVFGTEISLVDLKFIVLRPKPLVSAAIGQFILLPLLGLGLVRLLNYEPDIGLGLLMVACAPGGGNSNTATFLIDGEVPLSIAMTFFSTLLAIGMMPLNLWAYGRFISDDPKYSPDDIPYLKLVMALLIIVIPVGVGMFLNAKLQKVTHKVMRYAKPVVFVIVILFIIMAIWRSLYAFELVSWQTVLGAFALPFGGFLLGAIGSCVARLRLSQVKTIALEVGMQNAGIVVGMGFLVFRPPEADLNVILPIYISLLTSIIAVPLYLTHIVLHRLSESYRQVCKDNREAQMREKMEFDDSTSSDSSSSGLSLNSDHIGKGNNNQLKKTSLDIEDDDGFSIPRLSRMDANETRPEPTTCCAKHAVTRDSNRDSIRSTVTMWPTSPTKT